MMNGMVMHEWDVETLDEFGDIEDHNHCETLQPYHLDLDRNQRLVLVCDHYPPVGGLNRSWAYVENNTLPLYFEDAYGNKTTRVPKRFQLSLTALAKEI